MNERLIQPVANNEEKRETWAHLMGRYHNALKQGFYLEAMMISYAALEDRLISCLYHMGVFANRTKLKLGTKKTKQLIKCIFQENDFARERYNFHNISVKLSAIIAIAKETQQVKDSKDLYYRTLMAVCKKKINVAEILGLEKEILHYFDVRNEIVHASLNKNYLCLQQELRQCAEDGMRFARYFDNMTRRICGRGESADPIRRAARLSV